MSCDFDTSRVQAGHHVSEHNYVVSIPIYQTTTFALGDSYRADHLFSFSESDSIYTRLPNPTVDILEKYTAALYGASGAIALASDMVAVSCALLSAAGKGGRILTTARLYGGTVNSLGYLSPELGIKADFMENSSRIEKSEEKLVPDTKATLIESLTNPFATIPGSEAIARTAHVYGILLIIDNAVAIPYFFNLSEHGTDIVVHSATKALSGHGDAIAGLVLESGAFDYGDGNYPHFGKPLQSLRDKHDRPRNILQVLPQNPFTGRFQAAHLNYLGAALNLSDVYLVLIGLETLSKRVAKQVPNALTALECLEQSEYVLWVHYPYAQDSKYHALADCYSPKGVDSILSLGFRGTEKQKRAFPASVKVFGYQVNIGDARSLTINPMQTIHIELTEKQRLLVGLEVSTIRLSLRLKSPKDLIEDLQQAFDSVFQD